MVCEATEAIAIGKDCPNCGCDEAELLRRTSWWGKPTERVVCRNCGKEYTRADADAAEEQETPCIAFPVIRCPRCSSKKTKITSTRDTLRWHRCEDCQRPFTSLEK